MQVQHETQLLEGPTLRGEDFLADETTSSLDAYVLNQTTLNSIEWVTSCPTRNLVAVYLNGINQVVIIDTKTYSKRERLPLKPCDKKFSKQSLALKGIDFSPDGQRLAVGQSDCIIYIYKLPNLSTNQQTNPSIDATPTTLATSTQPPQQAKVTISGKFVCSTPVTCLLWTELGIVFGTQDGKIKLVSMGSSTKAPPPSGETKVIAVYNSPKANMPISFAFKSPLLVVGFLNSNVIVINLSVGGDSPAAAAAITATLDQTDLGQTFASTSTTAGTRRNSSLVPLNNSFDHSCPPYQLVILQANLICCAGSNGRVSFYQPPLGAASNKVEVNLVQSIDLKEDVVSMDYSSINEILALATTSRVMFIRYDQETSTWRLQNSFIELIQVALTSLRWLKSDGSQLIVGQSNGNLELFRCSWSKQSIGEQFDICHIAKNRVRITDRARNLLATYKSQYDIKRVNLLNKGQSVIIWTTHTILLARLGQLQQSEISWGRERNQIKFCFDFTGFVIIYNSPSSTLNLVRLGDDNVAYSVRLESGFDRRLISVRQYNSRSSANQLVDQLATSKSSPTSRLSAGPTRSRHGSMNSAGQVPEIQVSPDLAPTSELNLLPPTNQQQAIINERLALVLESNLIIVINLINSTNQKELALRHDHPVRWIELSYTGNFLLFVDAMDRMHLINLSHDDKRPLVVVEMNEFSRWLLETDILIAQSAHKIMIWYNVEEIKSIESFDSRIYNCTERLPMLDLSLLARKQAYPVVKTIEGQEQLVLSNGQVVMLDKVKVRFYTEIVRGRFDLALEVLNKNGKLSGQLSHLELWYKLGWLAIGQDDCQLGIVVFKKLRHQKMVRYLERCLEMPDELPWRLAMLKGQWQDFERLSTPEQIVATYRRLNKWSQLIDYLERNQQFRQRDLVEQEHKQWLLKEGRHLEAAQIQAKAGDKLGALELLLENNKLSEAVQLFVGEQKSPLKVRFSSDEKFVELAERLKRLLLNDDRRQVKEAALVSDRLLGAKEEALELYLEAKSYEEALELAKVVKPDEVTTIEGLIGEQLMQEYRAHKKSRRQTLVAIEHFKASGRTAEALEAAIELKQFEQAYEILLLEATNVSDSIGATLLKEKSLEVGEYFLFKKNDSSRAIGAYLAGGHHEKALELYLRSNQYKAAYELSLKSLFGGDRDKTRAHFVVLAEKMAQNGEFNEAERVYLEALEEPTGAIELHKRWSRDYERMLELLELHQPDQLEGQLLMLAKELEQTGRFEEAERYLLRVSETEWTNVVRMYRLAGKWPEAFRVAGEHCASREDPLLVQLAFWWSKSLGDSGEARELLLRLDLYQQVLDFCCDNKSHQFALDLCKGVPSDGVGRRVAKRYASFLEEQGKFGRAEEVLLELGMVEEACRMYLDNERPAEAIRVAEQRLEGDDNEVGTDDALLKRVLVECADKLASECEPNSSCLRLGHGEPANERRLEQARQMYLRAQRPELAVALYRSRGRWQEAVQVAQRFAPQLLEGLERALDEEVARGAVAEVVEQLDEESRSVSRSSSSLGGHRQAGDQQISAVTSNGDRHPLGKLQSQAEKSMRRGDARATKAALAQFLDALVDGPPGEKLSPL